MKAEIEISNKTFTSSEGEVIPYVAFTLKLGNQEFGLFPQKSDKKLINYILEQMGFERNEVKK